MHNDEPYAWDEHFINAWNKAEELRKQQEAVKPKEEKPIESKETFLLIINQKEFKL